MKLTKVHYKTAIFFGAFILVSQLLLGITIKLVEKAAPEALAAMGILAGNLRAIDLIIVGPLYGGITTYITVLLAIFIYNTIATKYPISWDVKK